MFKIVLLSFVFASFAHAAQDCNSTLNRLQDQGVTAEDLHAFYEHADSAKILDNVAGQKSIVLVDLTKANSENRFKVVDLKTGTVTYSCKTTAGTGNTLGPNGAVISFSKFKPGSHAAPGGLMRLGSAFSGPHSVGHELIGLEAVNRKIDGVGIQVQTCKNGMNDVQHHRSWGSFCLAKNDYKAVEAGLKGTYLYSMDPSDKRKNLSPQGHEAVCRLLGFSNALPATTTHHEDGVN